MESWKEDIVSLLETEFKTGVKSFDITIDLGQQSSQFNIEHDGECKLENYSYTDHSGQMFLFIPNSGELITSIRKILEAEFSIPNLKKIRLTDTETVMTF